MSSEVLDFLYSPIVNPTFDLNFLMKLETLKVHIFVDRIAPMGWIET